MNGLMWETEAFPEEECVHPCPREKGILEGKSPYLCVLIDRRFSDTARMIVAFPYTFTDNSGVLWGWTSEKGRQYYDHKTRSIHDDDERVVAWTRVPESFDMRTSLFPE